MSFIKDESIDMVCTHPPYADIIRYSTSIEEDLSHLGYNEFLDSMKDVAQEAFRVLKRGRVCAFMMGDVRENSYVKPLGMDTMQIFVNKGFRLKEIIIKEQHHCRSADYWQGRQVNFLLLAHEYIFALEKISVR